MENLKNKCQLCLLACDKFVDSHIIPRSFYEGYKDSLLKKIDAKDVSNSKRIQKGIYGQFLCKKCEEKFQKIDNEAFILIKNDLNHETLQEDENGAIKIIKNANNHKTNLHQFALSLLWRAAVCKRDEFKSVELGCYKEKIRVAVFENTFNQDLLDATGLWIMEFRGSHHEVNIDAIFQPYLSITKSSHEEFHNTYGEFHAHVFGFPYGEIYVRLGGEKPKKNMNIGLKNNFKKCVLWSTNLSENNPHLLIFKAPRLNAAGKEFATTNLMKNTLNLFKG
jgi:hypothetical protein